MLKIKKFLLGIWQECKDIKTLVLFLMVVAVVYSPVLIGYLLYLITSWEWCLAVATAVAAFWLGPFTPFFPLCVAITLTLKRALRHIMRGQKKGPAKESADEEKMPVRYVPESIDKSVTRKSNESSISPASGENRVKKSSMK